MGRSRGHKPHIHVCMHACMYVVRDSLRALPSIYNIYIYEMMSAFIHIWIFYIYNNMLFHTYIHHIDLYSRTYRHTYTSRDVHTYMRQHIKQKEISTKNADMYMNTQRKFYI